MPVCIGLLSDRTYALEPLSGARKADLPLAYTWVYPRVVRASEGR